MSYTTKELSPRTYSDFEQLAKKQGGCWCIYYQRAKPLRGIATRDKWARTNRRDKEKLVAAGRAHAILVYDKGMPVGWCQYGPGEELPLVDAGRFYRKLGRPPDGRLWRITCFFVDRKYRRKGVAKAGLSAAVAAIRRRGGGTVEAYPVVSEGMAAQAEWLWFGTPSMFEAEGFEKVAPLGTSRILVRKTVMS